MDSTPTSEPNPSHSPENLPNFTGHLIDEGRIIIQKRLDAGSFGSVYVASSTSSDAIRYAVKCMPKLDLNDSRRCQLQVNEIALHTLASAHPNIVTLHKHVVSQDGKYLFLILDLAKDGDLRKRVSTFMYNDDKIKSTMSQIIDAVQHLHDNNIYHRDLKLENILINGNTCWVADLGLATRDARSDGYNCGSLEYISPESMSTQCPPSDSFIPAKKPLFCAKQKDVWSLGVIFFNLMTAQSPWTMANDSDLNYVHFLKDCRTLEVYYDLSSEAHHVLMGLLNPDPNKRRPLRVIKQEILALKTCYSSKTPTAQSLLVPPPLMYSISPSLTNTLVPITPETRAADVSVAQEVPELPGDMMGGDRDITASWEREDRNKTLRGPSRSQNTRRKVC